MQRHPLPLIVLAGSDPRPPVLPQSGADLHPLRGWKGMELKLGGRPLIDLLLERLVASASFGPIFLAGPTRIYGERRGAAEVLGTEGTFGRNLRQAVTAVRRRCPGQPIALVTCDILPEVEELHALLEDYHRHQPLDFWFPVILAPETPQQLGASFWKPRYQIAPEPGEPPRTLLPGHLIVADPEALRLPLIYHSFDLAYKSRNRPILYRLWLIIGHVFLGLVAQDLKEIARLHLPSITFGVVYNGIALGLHLRRGVITPDELADRLRKIFVSFRHRRRFPDRRGRLPLMRGLSLAKDIDTQEEAEEMAEEMAEELEAESGS